MSVKQAIKVNPERQRKRFTPEFKREAVRLLEQGRKPATQPALELGVQRNRLYKWQTQLKAGVTLHAHPGRPRREDEGELTRLRRELKAVTGERDFLKEANAYFTKRRR
jgi:transposase